MSSPVPPLVRAFASAIASAIASAMASAMAIAVALSAAGCVDTATYDKTVSEVAELRRASQLKDEQLRAMQWQVMGVAQQLREQAARSEAMQREMQAEVVRLSAANATLAEQMKRVEDERARLAAAEEGVAVASRSGGTVRAEDVRRLLAAMEARHAAVLQELARIQRTLAGARGEPPVNKAAARPSELDLIDPWGGSRK